jgi:hypothetical protein
MYYCIFVVGKLIKILLYDLYVVHCAPKLANAQQHFLVAHKTPHFHLLCIQHPYQMPTLQGLCFIHNRRHKRKTLKLNHFTFHMYKNKPSNPHHTNIATIDRITLIPFLPS